MPQMRNAEADETNFIFDMYWLKLSKMFESLAKNDHPLIIGLNDWKNFFQGKVTFLPTI